MQEKNNICHEISLLCSLYKSELPGNLDRFFSSLKKQKVSPKKIVIVYDGDVSRQLDDIVQEYSEYLNVCVVKKEWSGLADALNLGSRYIDTEWFARCDTDDVALPDFIEFFCKKIRELNGDVAVISGSVNKHYGDMIVPDVNNNTLIGKHNFYFKFKNLVFHPASCIRLSAFNRSGGYKAGRMEDYRLWTSMLKLDYHLSLHSDVIANLDSINQTRRRVGFDYIKAEIDLFNIKVKSTPWYLPFDFVVAVFRIFLRFNVVHSVFSKVRN